jgi:hypothetical protein
VRRPDLAVVGQCQQLVVQRVEDLARAFGLLDRQVRSRHVADEQAVAAQHRPRLRAAIGVDQRERRVLGAVTRRMQGAHQQRAELQLPAILERLVLVVGVSEAVNVDLCARGRHQAPVARHVVGVVVRLQHVVDGHRPVARQLQVLVDLETRVDHGGHTGLLVADQIGGATEVVVGDLAKDHRCDSRASLCTLV